MVNISGEYYRVHYIIKLQEKVFLCSRMLEIAQTSSILYVEHLKSVIKEKENLQLLSISDVAEKCIFISTKKYSVISAFPNNVERY